MPPTASALSPEKSAVWIVLAASSPNEYSSENTDGWTDFLSPLLRKQPGVSEFSLQSLHNAQCPGEIPLIQKCRQLIINAAGLPIYRNNTRGSSYASCSSREQRKYLSQFEVCNWYTRVGFIHILLIYTLEILFPAEWQESGRQSK